MMSKKQYLQSIKKDWKHTEIEVKIKLVYVKEEPIKTAKQVYEFLKEIWNWDLINLQEQFVAVYLNRRNKIIGYRLISTGNMTSCAVDIKLVVSIALHTTASGVIIAHNHPSGSLQLSKPDETITHKIKEALALIDTELLDHLIITRDNFLSLGEEGVL